jgi:hypothetical protein
MRGIMRHALTAAALCLAAPALADTASVEIKAQVAGVCNTPQATVTEITFDPLHLQAMVNTNCNTTHTLTVTYSPPNPVNPVSLQMTFDGQPPTSTAPGSMTFSNLPMSNTAKLLVIQYSGPPPDRTSIKNSVQIQVSP